ncbi:MBL fold metallo-hydrolase [Chitinophaga lutea]|uniref:MBL fold metallo-hydrolase n=1 Tax=Chitinophaga lutea TaxID=2488634 RepID=A0A3N4PZG0_9BACT|nr:MBL fold metallo-hydrolase [Chitinophaga lutea]RPE14193.1 MBL fold metallo-hydrolase [Chitinophaga lutea]
MSLTAYLCTTCGTQYAPATAAPAHCMICEDERQYVNPKGQGWATLPAVNRQYKNIFEKVTDNLFAIYTAPAFAINQRAHLLITPQGNVLWDCIANLDDSTVELMERLGGIHSIAISHPHYYTTMAEWSVRFGDVPVYIHAGDRQWVARKDFNIVFWEGAEHSLLPGVKLVHTGGHFDGAAILHYNAGNGLLLVGDAIQVCPDLQSVSFMYSYPNYIPLPEKAILKIKETLLPLNYDAMYGAFGHYLRENAAEHTLFSIERYLKIFR